MDRTAHLHAVRLHDRTGGRAAAPKHPEWANNPVYKALAANDLRGALAGGEKPLLELLVQGNSGMTVEEYDKAVRQWLATARHPVLKRPYIETVYQPQLELLAYLRAKGFKTFIVSGGNDGSDAPLEPGRVWHSARAGGLGSSQGVKFDGNGALMREPSLAFLNDGPGKPVGIYKQIGRRPILAFGNSDGDWQMLQYTVAGPGRSLALLVHHDDAAREFAYDRTSPFGKLDKAWDEAVRRNWVVVSMKNDWKRVFADPKP